MENIGQTVKEIIEEDIYKDTGLKFIGMGAEKMVFETKGSTRKLVKIKFSSIRNKLATILEKEFNNNDIEERVNNVQKDLIDDYRKIEEDISQVFGKEHLLRNGVFKIKIPINKDVAIKLFEQHEYMRPLIEKMDDEKIYILDVIAETQIIAEELRDKQKFDTKSLNTDLVTDDNFSKEGDIKNALSYVRSFIDSEFLSEFDENSKNKKYVEIIKEIVTKIIQYTKKTGLMIDIFGPDNITIFKKEDGTLDYHLLDVILPGSQDYWKQNIKDDKNYDLLRHNYTFYYSIKSLADKLGIDNNLEPEDLVYFKGVGIPIEGKLPFKE